MPIVGVNNCLHILLMSKRMVHKIMKHQIICGMIVLSRQKKREALIKRLMNVNFKHSVIQYVIDIVTLCGGK